LIFRAETDQNPVAATDNGRAVTSWGHWSTGSLAPAG
jgi:hypothetical protein